MLFSKAQYPNPALFNTATNATGTGTIPVNANDLNWSVALTNSVGPYVPAVSCGNQAPGNWVTSTSFVNANWITYPHNCSANVAEHSCLGNTNEFYRLVFNLPASSCGQAITTPSAYCLSLDFFADNWVSEIFVNGILSVSNPTSNPYGSYGFTNSGKVTAMMCSNWQPGANTVIVHVQSGAPTFPGYSGLLAQANQTVNTSVGVPLSLVTTQTNVTCYGGNNGVGSIYPIISAGAINYTWTPFGGNSNFASGLTAGTYTILASNGICTATQTLTITEPPPMTVVAAPSATICQGGSAVLTATGANTYSWNTGSTASSITVNTAGNYSVTMTAGPCITTSVLSVTVEQPVPINISGNSICNGQTATVTASGANTYSWSTGGTAPTETIAATGNYTVTGVTAAGCINTQTFAVSAFSVPVITISGNTLVCQGQSATLNASGATSYTWMTGSNSPSINVSPSVTTNYSVTGSENGCISTESLLVNVALNPVISVSGNTLLCNGNSGTLIANGASTYTWSTGANNQIITINPASNVNYTLTGSSSNGCTGTTVVNVQVSSAPQLSVTGSKFCSGESGVLTAGGASVYEWNTGADASSVTVNPLVSTVYTVSAYGTSSLCVSSQTVLAEVVPSPSLSVNSNSINVCLNYPAELIAFAATTCTWSTGVSGSSITVTPLSSTVYTVSTTTSLTGCSSSRTIQVTVVNPPDIRIFGDSTVCEGDRVKLVATGGSNYLWSNAATSSSIEITVDEKTPFYTVMGIDTETGCYGLDTIEVGNSPSCCEFWIPNSFSPNEDQMNDEFGPKTFCKFEEYNFYIFDKWGEQIWHTSNVDEKWNGNHKGQLCKPDVYVYYISGTRLIPNKIYLEKTGHITLIR